MAKNYSSVKREIQIDECYSCFGKFLDGGELEKIRAEYPTEEERSADFANRLYSIVGEEYELLLKSNKEWDKNKKMNFVSKLFKRLTRFATLGIVDLDR